MTKLQYLKNTHLETIGDQFTLGLGIKDPLDLIELKVMKYSNYSALFKIENSP